MSTSIGNEADPVTGIALPGNFWVRGITGTTRWEPGTDRNISWAFGTTAAHGTFSATNSTLISGGTATGTYNALGDTGVDGALKTAVRAAIDSIEAVANININEFTDPNSFNTVDIKILGFDNLNALGWGTFPGTDEMPGGGGEFEGYTILATTGSGMTTAPLLGAGSNRQSTSLHEILHTLGMGHPHDTGHGSTSWTTSNNTGSGEDNLDNRRYTVMSYERGGLNVNNQGLNYGSDVTPMALDIASLHYLYGSRANHTGNTVYNLTDPETVALDVNGNDGSVSIGRAFYGIWDTGGTDSINYNGVNHALINLNEATLSSTDPSHVSAWIPEVASTGLYGTLSQELKDDISNASFHAGGFFSRVFYTNGTPILGGYSIANGLYATSAHNAGAIIENASGGNQADLIIGNEQSNTLNGNGGNDVIHGSAGGDSVYGGSGDDTLFGGADGDSLYGGAGIDKMYGGDGNDAIVIQPGWDGGTGEVADGGAGEDTLDLTALTQSTQVDLAGGFFKGGGGASSIALSNIENVFGSTVDDGINGNDGANTLKGAGGNDTINGLGGADLLYGGDGDDTINDGAGGDGVNGEGGNDRIIMGDAGINGDTYYGGAGIDTFDASGFTWATAVTIDLTAKTWSYSAGSEVVDEFENIFGANQQTGVVETLRGNELANVINGNGGTDVIFGMNGDDVLAGGAGGDQIDGGAGTDTASYATSTAGVTVSLANGTGSGGDAQGDTLTGIENLTGSAYADTLTGNSGSNVLTGGGGDDILVYADDFTGSGNVDTFNGDAGIDTFVVSNELLSRRYVDLSVGQFQLDPGGDIRGYLNSIENVTVASDHVVTGNGGANVITGTSANGANEFFGMAGNDILIGGGGGDILNGGSGIDTASYAGSSAGVVVSLQSGGASGGDAAGDSLASIENLIGSSFADTLKGSTGANSLEGGNGDDLLEGGAGGDALAGGAGTDTARYAASGAAVTISLLSGTSVGGDADGDALSGIENLIGSAYADFLKGDAASNRLEGLAGADRLDGQTGNDILAGGAGADILNGDAGFDIADYSTSSAGVTVSLATGSTAGGDAAGDTFSSIEGLNGSAYGDFLKGTAGANSLDGSAGDDILDGGAGGDTLIGGAGIDTARYASSTAAVTISLLSGGAAGGDAAGDTLTGIENLEGSSYADFLKGDTGANTLVGGNDDDRLDGHDGDDTLVGGAGADILNGDAGSDTASYVGSAAAVTVSLMSGAAVGGDAAGDTLNSIENLTGSAFADHLKGNAGSNVLNGGAGGDILNGDAGQDTASYAGSSAGVSVSLQSGNATGGDATGDTLVSIEHLIGSGFADYLKGSNAANILEGAAGADTLDGLGGNDRFVFGDGVGNDTVVGFVAGAGTDDRLDFTGNSFLDSFADILAHSSQIGADTVIEVGGGDLLTLLGVNQALLHQDDFVF